MAAVANTRDPGDEDSGGASQQDAINVALGEATAHSPDLTREQAIRRIHQDRPGRERVPGLRQDHLLAVCVRRIGVRNLDAPGPAPFENLLELASNPGSGDDHSALDAALRELVEDVPDQRQICNWHQIPRSRLDT